MLPVQKCNNVRDLYELPDFCPLNSPNLNTFISKYGAASLPEKVQDMNDLNQNLIDAWVGVEQSVIDDDSEKWRSRLHSSAFVSSRLQSSAFEPQEDILNIHHEIYC